MATILHTIYKLISCMIMIKILLKFIPIDNKSPAGHAIVWSLMGDMPLSKTMMDQFAKVYTSPSFNVLIWFPRTV